MIAPDTYVVSTVMAQSSCLILAAVLFAYSYRKAVQGRLGITVSLVLAVGLVVEAEASSNAFDQGFPISLLLMFGCGAIIWFRLVFLAGISVEGYRIRIREFGVLALLLAGYFASIYFDSAGKHELIRSFLVMWQGIIIVLNCLVLYIAFFALGANLAEARHPVRLSFLLPMVGVDAAFNMMPVLALLAAPSLTGQQAIEIVVTVALLIIVLLVAWGLTPQRKAAFGTVVDRKGEIDVVPTVAITANEEMLASGDQIVLNRLTILMRNEEFFKEPGLTIDQLSRRLAVPAYVLRRVINKGLNFRNFAGFLNHFRINAACEELSNPELSHKQIIGVAMDVGYQSLGPFNRAFKLAQGVTPSTYRKSALEGHPDLVDIETRHEGLP